MSIKRSTLAGTWYPAERAILARTVDTLLARAPVPSFGDLSGIVTPHAGYSYSGAVAAAAYRALGESRCERAVILAPSHRHGYRGVAICEADAFETPLGQVEIDSVRRWRPPLVRCDPRPFDEEHSLEIQLPFLQRAVPGASVVPLLFGRLETEDYGALAVSLDELAGPGTVFVVSSDFTHFGRAFGYEPFPADDAPSVRERLRDLDMGAIAPILGGDGRAFRRFIATTGNTVCGRVPIAAFLAWLGPAGRGVLVDYQTSLDVTGDFEHTVSYASIVFPLGATA